MEPRSLRGRLLCYVLLLLGSFVFMFPFVWLVSTSLKPLEQTVNEATGGLGRSLI